MVVGATATLGVYIPHLCFRPLQDVSANCLGGKIEMTEFSPRCPCFRDLIVTCRCGTILRFPQSSSLEVTERASQDPGPLKLTINAIDKSSTHCLLHSHWVRARGSHVRPAEGSSRRIKGSNLITHARRLRRAALVKASNLLRDNNVGAVSWNHHIHICTMALHHGLLQHEEINEDFVK
jgi:hypothetical protein